LLSEAVVVSTGRGIRVRVVVDGVLALDADFDSLRSVGQYLKWVDAFEADGNYVVRVSGISFLSGLEVYAEPSSYPSPEVLEFLAKVELLSG